MAGMLSASGISDNQQIAGTNLCYRRNSPKASPFSDRRVVVPGPRAVRLEPTLELIILQSVAPFEEEIDQAAAIGVTLGAAGIARPKHGIPFVPVARIPGSHMHHELL